jgi:hypothetical protein
MCYKRVSEISTLILISDSSRQEQQNFYVSFFRNIIFISVFIDNNAGHFQHFL